MAPIPPPPSLFRRVAQNPRAPLNRVSSAGDFKLYHDKTLPAPRSLHWISVAGALAVLIAGGAFAWKNQNDSSASPSRIHSQSSRAGARSRRATTPEKITGAAVTPIPPTADARWDADWRRLSAPTSTADNRDADSPLADGGNSSQRSEQLLALHPEDRIAFVATALTKAAQRSPAEAVRDAIRFCDDDPAYSLEYGRSLISTLSTTGDFRAALRFVLAQESEGSLGENGPKWLSSLFTTWASSAPAEAAEASQNAIGAGLRGEALQTLAAVWVKSDPTSLANFVWQLPPSSDRDRVWEATLRQWKENDPTSAAAWLSRRGAR